MIRSARGRRWRQHRHRTPTEFLVLPPPERGYHDEIKPVERAIADTQGRIGRPYVIVDLLSQWLDKGLITQGQMAAADSFRLLFRLAQLDGLRAADLMRTPNLSRASAWDAPPVNAERARWKLREICQLLEPRDAHLLVYVVGFEMSLREWQVTFRIRARNGTSGIWLRNALARL
jgi:hypothetical protein